jgi:hypothetical protein
MAKPFIGFRVDRQLQREVEQAADDEHRSVSNFMRHVVWEYLDRHGGSPRRAKLTRQSTIQENPAPA